MAQPLGRVLFWRAVRTLSACVLLVPVAHAQETESLPEPSRLQLTGYASLIYQHESQAGVGFRRDYTQSEDWASDGTFLPDSRLGLQAHYRLDQAWNLAGQLTLKDRGKNHASAGLEWGFLEWLPSPDVAVRAGKLPLDLFLMSEYQGLGYAYLPIRSPSEFYAVSPAVQLTGVDLAWNQPAGNGLWRAKVQLGQTDAHTRNQEVLSPTMQLRQLFNASAQYEEAPWRVRLGYAQGSLSGGALVDQGLAQLQTLMPSLSGDVLNDAVRLGHYLHNNHINFRYYSVAAAYDDGVWTGQAEWSKANSPSPILPVGQRYYLLLGRRVETFTPYLMWAQVRPKGGSIAISSDWSAVPAIPGFASGNAFRDQVVGFLNVARQDSRTLSLGLRWDVGSQTALKFQWDRVHINAYGYAPWAVSPQQRSQGAHFNLFSVGVDHVF